MTKKINIEKAFDYQYFVIGIASDEPIWKLCWEINQQLQLKFVKKEADDTYGATLDTLASKVMPLLFESDEMANVEGGYYEDLVSHHRLELALFENSARKVGPKEARPFRYLFVLRAEGEEKPDIEDFITKLNLLAFIISAVDISHIKNIKNIIR